MSVNWEQIRFEFESTNVTMKALAERHNIKSATLRSRKNREKWERNEKPKDVATQRNNATQRKNVATKKESVAQPDRPKLVIDNDELTEQQKMFCLYYLQSFDATKAYRLAYGVKYDTANAHGYKMLSNVVVKKELTRLKAELQQDVHINTKDLIADLAKQAKADINDFVEYGQEIATDDDGNDYIRSYMRFKDMDEVDGTMIDNIKLGRDGVSVQLPNKQKAIELLLKHLVADDAPDTTKVINRGNDEMQEWLHEHT